MKPTILPPKCFDILEASVMTYGLGAGRNYRFNWETEQALPCCFVGHWEHCFGDGASGSRMFGITTQIADKAVYAINKAKHVMPGSRVTWIEFCGQVPIFRGAERSCDLPTHDSSLKYAIGRIPKTADTPAVAGQPLS